MPGERPSSTTRRAPHADDDARARPRPAARWRLAAAAAYDASHHHIRRGARENRPSTNSWLSVRAMATGMSLRSPRSACRCNGGMGFIEETGAAQYYHWRAKIPTIYEGTTDPGQRPDRPARRRATAARPCQGHRRARSSRPTGVPPERQRAAAQAVLKAPARRAQRLRCRWISSPATKASRTRCSPAGVS